MDLVLLCTPLSFALLHVYITFLPTTIPFSLNQVGHLMHCSEVFDRHYAI